MVKVWINVTEDESVIIFDGVRYLRNDLCGEKRAPTPEGRIADAPIYSDEDLTA